MRSQCSLYVDAGYLLAAAATRVTGTSLRSGIHVNYAQLVTSLIQQAESSADMPVLRVHWYDAAKNGIPDPQQERIGELARVKLRLGRFGVDGQQKGVDLRIGLDLVTHARNSASAVCFLVSGDDDLTEAVEECQVHGVRVVVLAVPTSQGGPHAVSRHLLRAADDLELVAEDAIDGAVLKVETPPAQRKESGAAGAAVVPAPAGPSPLMLSGAKRASAPVSPRGRSTLAWTTSTGSAASISGEGDYVALDERIDSVAASVVGSVLASASKQDIQALLTERPSIPREIDKALLVDLSSKVGTYDLSDPERFALRARFWQLLDQTLQAANR